MTDDGFLLRPIGVVRSALTDLAAAPCQGDEGAPDAVVVVDAEFATADTLAVHPRDDRSRPLTGVFATRSSDRPNPIGLHQVEILAVDATRLHVRGLEAIDGTPVVDIKPTLGTLDER
jgi:tRNA-Thr(GGU) m(6)t(6)A37 methyltransferase TsaA